MRRVRSAGWAGAAAAGILVGVLIAPQAATALGSVVTIEDAASTNRAKVTSLGKLLVDIGSSSTAGRLNVNQRPSGNQLLFNGPRFVSDSTVCNMTGLKPAVISGVVAEFGVTTAGNTPLVSMTIKNGTAVVYRVTLRPGMHINDVFDGGLTIGNWSVECSTNAGAQFFVYGYFM